MVTWRQGWGVDNKGARGKFWGDGNVLNVDGGAGGYMSCMLVKLIKLYMLDGCIVL